MCLEQSNMIILSGKLLSATLWLKNVVWNKIASIHGAIVWKNMSGTKYPLKWFCIFSAFQKNDFYFASARQIYYAFDISIAALHFIWYSLLMTKTFSTRQCLPRFTDILQSYWTNVCFTYWRGPSISYVTPPWYWIITRNNYSPMEITLWRGVHQEIAS